MATSIEDLANELLYAIFDYLDEQSLSSLSLVSRTLHRPALETVIIRLGGNSNMEKDASFYDSPFALLRAVRSALFIQSLRRVRVLIFAKGSMIFLAELAQLFNRMTHITDVYISLRSIGPMEDDFMLKMAHRTLASLAGKNCTTLTLNGWDIPDSKSKSILLEGGTTSDSNPAKISQSENALPLISTLTRLSLKKCHILATPILRWIIDSSNQSRITKCLISQPSRHTINSTLSLLALPYLTRLCIYSMEIEVDKLLPFLSRHPTLRDLSLTLSAVRETALDRSVPPPIFPNLESLAISPDILPHILQIDVLPQLLKSVTLRPNISSTSESRIDEAPWQQAMEDALTCLAERKGVQRLAFSFPSQELVKAWLTSERCNVESLMTSVTTISISTHCFKRFGADMEPILGKWLALFPTVEHVEVDDDLFATGWNGPAFVSRLAKECPRIRTIKIESSLTYGIADLEEGSEPESEAWNFAISKLLAELEATTVAVQP